MFRRKKKDKERGAGGFDSRALSVQDLFAPDGMLVGFDRLRLGTGYARVYAVHALPRRLQVGWLDEVLNAGDVDVAVHLAPAPDRDVIRRLERRENQAATRMIQEQGARASLAILVEELRALRTAIELGNDRLFYVTFLIAVHAQTEEELRRRCDAVESALARRGARPAALVLRQLDGLKSVVPVAACRLTDFEKNLTGGAAACCLPLSVAAGGHGAGVLLGHNIYTRAPVFLDRFAGEHVVPNQHAFISGETGSGKSVTLRTLALLEAYRGVRAAFVDPEGEYVHFTQALGGQVVHLRPGVFSGINPLDVEPEVDDGGRQAVNLQDKMADLHGLVAAVFRYQTGQGLDVREAALLEEAVREEYAAQGITPDPASLYRGGVKKPMPTLSDVQARLGEKPGAERVADGMKLLLKDGSLGMFDGQTTLYLQDVPFVCFNLRGLGSEFARFVGVYATLAWLWQSFAQRGGRAVKKSVAIDEAWMFLRHPDAAFYLETLARRGRKHGCAVTVATQRFEEFASTREGRAVIESCATILVLKQEEHAALAAVEYFKLASGCADLLARARAGQGILRVSGSTTAVQVSPAPFEWPLVETRLKGA
ncbi:MAG: VirB4 family type IV secretion system protein [Desulfotomaculales bacterium]